ncbi:MAG: hypothetical protein IKO47_12880 [Ruminococcus sp.]|nr:hypothetical protein [Ruminococcus sp.]
MQEMIWGVIGIIIMIVSVVFLVRLLQLKKHGITVLAEVLEVSELTVGRKKRVNGYAHKMRYEVNGKMIEAVDKAGYNQPFEVGSKQLIVYDPKKPERFEYEDGLKKNIVLFAVMIAVTVVFSAYWIAGGTGIL